VKVVLFINIVTAIFVSAVGLYFLFIPLNIDKVTRIIFAFVFVGYGIYRLLNVYTKRQIFKQEEKREKILEAQEKLIRDAKNAKNNEQ
jgi:hypothetical protein